MRAGPGDGTVGTLGASVLVADPDVPGLFGRWERADTGVRLSIPVLSEGGAGGGEKNGERDLHFVIVKSKKVEYMEYGGELIWCCENFEDGKEQRQHRRLIVRRWELEAPSQEEGSLARRIILQDT